MKPDKYNMVMQAGWSPPVRGAWIETAWVGQNFGGHGCRPPCGGRGLKLLYAPWCPLLQASPPVRGAWIETAEGASVLKGVTSSPPVRGAWIETGQ